MLFRLSQLTRLIYLTTNKRYTHSKIYQNISGNPPLNDSIKESYESYSNLVNNGCSLKHINHEENKVLENEDSVKENKIELNTNSSL